MTRSAGAQKADDGKPSNLDARVELVLMRAKGRDEFRVEGAALVAVPTAPHSRKGADRARPRAAR